MSDVTPQPSETNVQPAPPSQPAPSSQPAPVADAGDTSQPQAPPVAVPSGDQPPTDSASTATISGMEYSNN
ncbi:hypothetical protein KUTeg_008857 [Tegillarca granosa]|uniref:Uncharacterized protein n=1 Tax=Tegillarca granosa TaxID=220873 RepID=A0ABQ9FCF6_TEGGR|nr:hypothetical protein KUTeg_008857 [Tegillarca granosa]